MIFEKNPLLNGRFVFLDVKKDGPPANPGKKGGTQDALNAMQGYYYTTGLGPKEASSEAGNPSADTKGALEDVKKGVEETEEEKRKREELASKVVDKLTPTKRENLKKRMIVDIYNNDKELADKYFDAVKDSIEKMSKDELYQFIFDHTPPRETYVKSEHEKWNKEFCALLDKYMPDDLKAGEDVQKQAYTIGGLQNYLVNDFSPANVFQAGRNKRMTNPFIWVDGKMGAYTVSVMAEYWNKKYGPTSKDKAPLTNANIDESLATVKKNREFYNSALVYLATQLKGAPVDPTPQTTGDSEVAAVQPTVKETREQKRERLKAALKAKLVQNGAAKEALFAFDMAYDERFKHEIKTSIDNTAGFNQNEPDSWAIIHLLMAEKNPDYANAFLAVPEEGAPAVANTPAGTPEAPKETGKNPKDEIRAELIGKKASREALFAFEMSDTKDFKSNIDEAIKIKEETNGVKFDNKNPKAWGVIHFYMMESDSKYAEAFAAAPEKITPAVATGKKPAEKDKKEKSDSAKATSEPEKKEPVVSDKLVEDKKGEENLKKEKFVNYFCGKAELKDLDFIGSVADAPKSSEEAVRRQFAEEIYGLCIKIGLPASENLADMVIKKIHKPGTNDIEYGPGEENLAKNRKLLQEVEASLRKEYLDEYFERSKDILDRNNFGDLLKGFIEKKGIGFDGYDGGYTSESGAKFDFGKQMFDICEDLGLPANEVIAAEITDILIAQAKSGNKIQYSGMPTNEAIPEEWRIEQMKYVLQDRRTLNKVRDELIKLHPEIKNNVNDRKVRVAEREKAIENEKGIGLLAFASIVTKFIDKEDFDFNDIGEMETAARKAFGTEIGKKLIEKKQPLTISLAKRVVESLGYEVTGGNNIDYYGNPTDEEQEATNKAIVDAVLGRLAGKGGGEIPEKLTDEGFIDKMITLMDSDFDFDFEGDEENARKEFAKDMLERCKKLGLPLTDKLVEDILLITDYRFVSGFGIDDYYKKGVAKNDFFIYDSSKKNEELNKEVIDTIAYYLAKEYGKSTAFFLNETQQNKTQPQGKAKTEVASR
jgi:hypothetical protein